MLNKPFKTALKAVASEKFVICFDTICGGYTAIMDAETETPALFDTEGEACAEIASDPEFYADCFACPYSEIGRKTIFTGKETVQ